VMHDPIANKKAMDKFEESQKPVCKTAEDASYPLRDSTEEKHTYSKAPKTASLNSRIMETHGINMNNEPKDVHPEKIERCGDECKCEQTCSCKCFNKPERKSASETFCNNPDCDENLKVAADGHLHPSKTSEHSCDGMNCDCLARASKPPEPIPVWDDSFDVMMDGCMVLHVYDTKQYQDIKTFIKEVERTAEERGREEILSAIKTYSPEQKESIEAKARAEERKRIISVINYALPKTKILAAGINVHNWHIGYKEAAADILASISNDQLEE
jgi:hypothetical protein